MLDITQTLLLVHIWILGIPMIVAAAYLLLVTVRIRRILAKYSIQRELFKGILLVGYLFILIATMHFLSELVELYGYNTLALEIETVWHAVALGLLVVLVYSFYGYLRTVKRAEQNSH